jgi:hypothetical protein
VHIEALELHAFRTQPVDVRCGDGVRPVTSEVPIPLVVRQDKQDIRALASLLSDDGKRYENYDEGESASPLENIHDISSHMRGRPMLVDDALVLRLYRHEFV